jgi:tRNA (guanine-N7-)-methyltransferase
LGARQGVDAAVAPPRGDSRPRSGSLIRWQGLLPVHPGQGDSRRAIRSFVIRGGRLTRAQRRAFRDLWPCFGVDWAPGTQLDLTALFGNQHPVFLEIGFGNGETLAELAERHPERNFLGVEVHPPGIGHLLLEVETRALRNVRILRQDAVELLASGLPLGCLAGVYLFFPDPWPKKRHHKRRLLNPRLVRLLGRAIRHGGAFHAATDWEPYAQEMLQALDQASDLFANTAAAGGFAPRPQDRPLTKFEERGNRLGHGVRDLVYCRR